MKRILLTGGSGFIGRNIRESFLADEYEIVAPGHAELDLRDEAAVDSFVSRGRFDAIIHGATKPGHRNAKDPTDLFYSNTRMFFSLARQAKRVERMIVLGSGAIYDQRRYHAKMREEEWRDSMPADEHGFCKYVCADAIEGSENIFDLRLFGIFGKFEDYSIRFISNMICKALFGLPLTMMQDRVFSYLFIDDLMPLVDKVLVAPPRLHSYNVAPNEGVSLLSLAEIIRDRIDPSLKILVAADGRGSEYTADNSRLAGEYPDLSFTPLSAAIDSLIGYYRGVKDRIQRSELEVDK